MQARGVDADVVTCCSLISALERGGQWHLAQQLFLDMCRAAAAAGSPQVLRIPPFELSAGRCCTIAPDVSTVLGHLMTCAQHFPGMQRVAH